jgi:hypothetical protein
MSTDLYRLRVLALDPARRSVTLRVFLVYYDWSGVPTDPSFFLRVLWDEADTRFGRGGPLGDEISVEQLCSEQWIDANTQRFIERVTRQTLHNHPLPPGWTPPTFIYSNYKEEDKLTQGDYEVIVTDAKWISHLKVGQTWQTTGYETEADMPPERVTVLVDAPMKRGAAKPKPAKQAAKTTTAKTTTAKKAPAKQATKKTSAKKATKKTAAKKTSAKKATKKTTAKKTAAKKNPAKKTAAKKNPAKKTAAKKTPAKKSATKKSAAKATSSRPKLRPMDL